MSDVNVVIGLDYGTDSVRALVVDTRSGAQLASAIHPYSRWKEGRYCDPANNRFRQHPLDYIEGLEDSIREALSQAPPGTAAQVTALSIDTTGSTPVAVNREGTPLALLPDFSENPNAMFILWKDHAATAEADQINWTARDWGGGTDFTKYEGGIYSSEWFWAKVLHTLRIDTSVREAAFSWVEHCDWLPALLTGDTAPLTIPRSRCAAGHKAMWHASWGGLPMEEFLVRVDPLLAGIRDRLYTETQTSDRVVGTLSSHWAERLGLSTNVVVGVGAFDAHMGAVGAQIVPGALCKVMGTSTCDMLVAPQSEIGGKLVRGICGQVDGSIVPGLIGLEAGQSAFGDIFAWFRNMLMWPVERFCSADSSARASVCERMIAGLEDDASRLPIDESGVVALDWMNGRRTPDANQLLKGVIAGLNLGSDAPRIYRALVEATAFGSRTIVERFAEEGVTIGEVIALGGISRKSKLVMQVVADVLNMPIKVVKSEQTCALGAAMFAAVVGGAYATVQEAQKCMGSGFECEYRPDPAHAKMYERLYARYSTLARLTEEAMTP